MATILPTTLYDFSKVNVHWFPQHMNIGIKHMRGILGRCDVILEVRDCRIPFSSASPLLANLLNNNKTENFIIFNKSDLADPEANKRLALVAEKKWPGRYHFLSSKKQEDYSKLLHMLKFTFKSVPEKKSRRMMVVGMPNVGKSTIINRLRALGVHIGGKAVNVGNKPGITRKVSGLVKLLEDPLVYMLDSPGILMPKIVNSEQGMKLAITGAIVDTILDDHLLADYVLHTLRKHHKEEEYVKHFGMTRPAVDTLDFIEAISKASNWPKVNIGNSVQKALKAFREGSFGRITLDNITDERNNKLNFTG